MLSTSAANEDGKAGGSSQDRICLGYIWLMFMDFMVNVGIKTILGGGNSNIFLFSTLLTWGFMIHFDDVIFLGWAGSTTN